MKRISPIVSAALSLVLLFAFAVPAAAESGTQRIEITYRAVKIAVDGALIVPADASGAKVEPFIYRGTTYLPVRAVAGAFSLAVEWDAGTGTVVLTSGAATNTGSGTAAATNGTKYIEITYRDIRISLDGETLTPTDASGAAVEPFIYNGTTYLPVRAVAEALGVEVGWNAETSTVYLGEQPRQTLWLLATATDYDGAGAVSNVDTYTYDEYGRCTAINTHYPGDPGSDSTVTSTYDAAGNKIFEDYGDGYSRYSYDEDGNQISDKYYFGGSMTEWQYTYDASGRVIKTTVLSDGDTIGTSVCTYDASGDLVKAVTAYSDYTLTENLAYDYDASGLLQSLAYTYSGDGYDYGQYYLYHYDAAGRLSVEYQYWMENGEKSYFDTNRYTYDANGNLASLKYDSGYTVYAYISMEA